MKRDITVTQHTGLNERDEALCLLALAVPSILLWVDMGRVASDSVSRPALGPPSFLCSQYEGLSLRVNRKACSLSAPNAEAKNAWNYTSTLRFSSCRGA
jgi:hypothetical protein